MAHLPPRSGTFFMLQIHMGILFVYGNHSPYKNLNYKTSSVL